MGWECYTIPGSPRSAPPITGFTPAVGMKVEATTLPFKWKPFSGDLGATHWIITEENLLVPGEWWGIPEICNLIPDSSSSSSPGSSSPGSSSPSSSSPSSSSPSSSSPSSSSPSSKSASVRVGKEWVGWKCAEGPVAWFDVRVELKLNVIRKTAQGWHVLEGIVELVSEVLLSCEHGSLRPIEALISAPGLVSARMRGGSTLAVTAACPRRPRGTVAATALVRGVRLGHDRRWPRFPEAVAEANDDFYQTATLITDHATD